MKTERKFIEVSILFQAIEDELALGNKASFTVTGMSMWPFICHGRDSVTVTKPDSNALRIGDIVLLRVPTMDKYLLHRITHIKKASKMIETTGDGNCFRDGWFPADCVIGLVTEIEYRGKNVPVNEFKHQFLASVWRVLYPVRPVGLKVLRMIAKIKRIFRK